MMLGAFGVLKKSWRLVYIICVPILLIPVAACIGGKAGWCAYTLLLMAFYWSAEVVPLAVTSLMPVFLFPFLGIVPSSKVATFYLNVSVKRLLLGFMLVTMSLSMWIPNTASTSIMAPIVMAVVDQMHNSAKDVESK
ncbi:hypothetical protein HPB49_025593 [Dermacentor silvarum]|uniref:Uncharacterized protein n=1 Tax=Dermacentor silvarum TaxID=543639 RepID=A0ACB8D9B3_DERSI|nr:hypothetical protein HPB49_025593 [Dermacentor silvarum]